MILGYGDRRSSRDSYRELVGVGRGSEDGWGAEEGPKRPRPVS